jgi:hypothetical protein
MEAPVRFKHRAWIPVAWSLSVINVGAVWFAALPAEPAHATVHALLAVGFALGARRLMARRQGALPNEDLQQVLDQNEQMQQTIDSMEAQVRELEERVDFAERLVAQQKDAQRQPLQP